MTESPRALQHGEPLSTEGAVELFFEHRRRGDAIDAAEFVARHPALAPELESALEGLLALEEVTQDRGAEPPLERIASFRVLREIGRGGMGVVLEAVEERLNRHVALKVLPPELVASASARARFRREAELAARLDHPGIATIFGAGVDGDRPWIAMRYVAGETLSRSIAAARAAGWSSVRLASGRGGASAARDVAQCVARVARALHSAHEIGVVHRDVKPSNIIVASDGTPVLLDFGLAIAEETEGSGLTRTGETAGTPAYLAPEIVNGERARPDVQSDIYALGVTLYECIALRRPFDAPTPVALYRAIGSGVTPALRSTNRAVPRDLAVIVATAMERDRARRYRTAAALAADLEAFADGRPIAARAVSVHERVWRWAKREPRQAALVGMLGASMLVAVFLVGVWLRSRSEVQAAARLTNADRFESTLRAGFGDLAVNRLDAADSGFARALDIVPRDPEALAGRALVRMKQHRDADAVAALAEAPDTPAFRALRALASGALPSAEHDEHWFASASAIEMFVDGMRLDKQIERAPRSERAQLSKLAFARFQEAVDRSHTMRMAFHVQRALAAEAAGDEAAARSAAASLVVLWPDQARAVFTAGLALSGFDRSAALPLLERAIEIDPKWEPPYQVLANVRYARGDLAEAEGLLRRALALDPRDADAFNSLGAVLKDQGCADEARAAFVSVLSLRPMVETIANLGVLDANAERWQDAEHEIRAALDEMPRQAILRVNLGQVLYELGRKDQALAELDIVAGFEPTCPNAWRWMSRWRAERGDGDGARAAAEAGLAFVPGDAQLASLCRGAASAGAAAQQGAKPAPH